jgi:hypothetical protein
VRRFNNPYGIIMEAYPFVARKPLEQMTDRDAEGAARGAVLQEWGRPQITRPSVINSALGVIARQQGGAFVDFDLIPVVPLICSRHSLLQAVSCATVVDEAVGAAADILLRQGGQEVVSPGECPPAPPAVFR